MYNPTNNHKPASTRLKSLTSATLLTTLLLTPTTKTNADIIIGTDDPLNPGTTINTDITDNTGNPLTPAQILTENFIHIGNTTDGNLLLRNEIITTKPSITLGKTPTAQGHLTLDNTTLNLPISTILNQGSITLQNQSNITIQNSARGYGQIKTSNFDGATSTINLSSGATINQGSFIINNQANTTTIFNLQDPNTAINSGEISGPLYLNANTTEIYNITNNAQFNLSSRIRSESSNSEININTDGQLNTGQLSLDSINTEINLNSGGKLTTQELTSNNKQGSLHINMHGQNTQFNVGDSQSSTNRIKNLNLNITDQAIFNSDGRLSFIIGDNQNNITGNASINISNNATMNFYNNPLTFNAYGNDTNISMTISSGATINTAGLGFGSFNGQTSLNTLTITDPNTNVNLSATNTNHETTQGPLSISGTNLNILNGATLTAISREFHTIDTHSTINISGNNATLNLGASPLNQGYTQTEINAREVNLSNSAKINSHGLMYLNMYAPTSSPKQTINIQDPDTIWKHNGRITVFSNFRSNYAIQSEINLTNQAKIITGKIEFRAAINTSPTIPSSLNISGIGTTLSAVTAVQDYNPRNFQYPKTASLQVGTPYDPFTKTTLNLYEDATLNTPQAYISSNSIATIKDSGTTWNAYEIYANGSLKVSNGATINIADKLTYQGGTSSYEPKFTTTLTITGQNTTVNLGSAQTIINIFEQPGNPQNIPALRTNENAILYLNSGNSLIADGGTLNTPNVYFESGSITIKDPNSKINTNNFEIKTESFSRQKNTTLTLETPNAIRAHDMLLQTNNPSTITLNLTADQDTDAAIQIANDLTIDAKAKLNILTDNLDDLALDDTFTLINIDGNRIGQFTNLNENQIIQYQNNLALRLTYLAGDGNDIGLITTQAPELGDTNDDGQINQQDLDLAIQHFGTSSILGDANHDNTVNLQDIFLLRNILKTNTPFSIPEPSTLFTLLTLAPLTLRRKNRRSRAAE